MPSLYFARAESPYSLLAVKLSSKVTYKSPVKGEDRPKYEGCKRYFRKWNSVAYIQTLLGGFHTNSKAINIFFPCISSIIFNPSSATEIRHIFADSITEELSHYQYQTSHLPPTINRNGPIQDNMPQLNLNAAGSGGGDDGRRGGDRRPNRPYYNVYKRHRVRCTFCNGLGHSKEGCHHWAMYRFVVS